MSIRSFKERLLNIPRSWTRSQVLLEKAVSAKQIDHLHIMSLVHESFEDDSGTEEDKANRLVWHLDLLDQIRQDLGWRNRPYSKWEGDRYSFSTLQDHQERTALIALERTVSSHVARVAFRDVTFTQTILFSRSQSFKLRMSLSRSTQNEAPHHQKILECLVSFFLNEEKQYNLVARPDWLKEKDSTTPDAHIFSLHHKFSTKLMMWLHEILYVGEEVEDAALQAFAKPLELRIVDVMCDIWAYDELVHFAPLTNSQLNRLEQRILTLYSNRYTPCSSAVEAYAYEKAVMDRRTLSMRGTGRFADQMEQEKFSRYRGKGNYSPAEACVLLQARAEGLKTQHAPRQTVFPPA